MEMKLPSCRKSHQRTLKAITNAQDEGKLRKMRSEASERPLESIRLPTEQHQTMVPQACIILVLLYLFILETSQMLPDREELCETLPSEIHIIKEEFDELGRLQRTCNGEISVNKCEGACNSQVQPSVITPTGFLKECYCCRESYLRERIITLTHCYDPDGMRLTSDDNKSMEIKLKEPNDCKCSKCGDYSR